MILCEHHISYQISMQAFDFGEDLRYHIALSADNELNLNEAFHVDATAI